MSLAYDMTETPIAIADRLDAQLRNAHPGVILAAAVEMYGDRLALVSSFGSESAVLLHLVARADPATPPIPGRWN